MNLDELQIKISIELDDLNKQLKTLTKDIDKALGPKATKKLMADNNKIIKSGLTAINKTTLNLVKKSRKDTTKEIDAMSKDINKSLTKAFDINLTKFNSNITSAMNQARSTVRSACNDIRRELNAALNINGNIRVTSKTSISGSGTGSSSSNVATTMASSQYIGAMIIKSTNAMLKNNNSNTKRLESKIDKATNKIVSAIKNIKSVSIGGNKAGVNNNSIGGNKTSVNNGSVGGRAENTRGKTPSVIEVPYEIIIDEEPLEQVEDRIKLLGEGFRALAIETGKVNFILGKTGDLFEGTVQRMREAFNMVKSLGTSGINFDLGDTKEQLLSVTELMRQIHSFKKGIPSDTTSFILGGSKEQLLSVTELMKQIHSLRKGLSSDTTSFILGDTKEQLLSVVELMKKIHSLRKGLTEEVSNFALSNLGGQTLRGEVIDKFRPSFTEQINVKEIIEGTFRDITDEVEEVAEEIKKATTTIRKATAMPGSKKNPIKEETKKQAPSFVYTDKDTLNNKFKGVKAKEETKTQRPSYTYTDKGLSNNIFEGAINNSADTVEQINATMQKIKNAWGNDDIIPDIIDAVDFAKLVINPVKEGLAQVGKAALGGLLEASDTSTPLDIKQLPEIADNQNDADIQAKAIAEKFDLSRLKYIKEELQEINDALNVTFSELKHVNSAWEEFNSIKDFIPVIDKLLSKLDKIEAERIKVKIDTSDVQRQIEGARAACEMLLEELKTGNINAVRNLFPDARPKQTQDNKKQASKPQKPTTSSKKEHDVKRYDKENNVDFTSLDKSRKKVIEETKTVTDTIGKVLHDVGDGLKEAAKSFKEGFKEGLGVGVKGKVKKVGEPFQGGNKKQSGSTDPDDLALTLEPGGKKKKKKIQNSFDLSGSGNTFVSDEQMRKFEEFQRRLLKVRTQLEQYQNEQLRAFQEKERTRWAKAQAQNNFNLGDSGEVWTDDQMRKFQEKNQKQWTKEQPQLNKPQNNFDLSEIDSVNSRVGSALKKLTTNLNKAADEIKQQSAKSGVNKVGQVFTGSSNQKDTTPKIISDLNKDTNKLKNDLSSVFSDLADESDAQESIGKILTQIRDLREQIYAIESHPLNFGVDVNDLKELEHAKKALRDLLDLAKESKNKTNISAVERETFARRAQHAGEVKYGEADNMSLGFSAYRKELEQLSKLAKKVGAKIRKALKTAFDSIKGPLALNSALLRMENRAVSVFNNIRNKAKAVFSKIATPLANSLSKVTTSIKNTANKIVNPIKNAMSRASALTKNYGITIKAHLNKAFTGIKSSKLYTSVSTGLNKAKGAVSKFSGKVKPILNKAFNGIGAIPKVASNIGKGLNKAKGVLSKFANSCKTIWGKIKQIFSKGANDASKATGKLTSGLKGLLSQAFGFFSIYGLINLGREAITQSQTLAQSEIKLASLMQHRMGATKETIEAIRQMAEEHSKLGVVSKTAMTKGAEQLSMYVHSAKALKDLMPAIANLTAKRGGFMATPEDAEEVATQLGEAIREGTTTPLEQSGIYLSEAEIKKFQALRTEEERAAYLANVIANNVGNINQALANTPLGAMTQLKNNFKELLGTLGIFLANVLKPIVKWLNTIVVACNNALKALGKLLGFDMTGGAESVADMNVGGGTPSTEVDTGGVDSATDSYNNAADAADKATEANEKFKGSLMGFDEINILSDNTSSNSSSDPSDEYDPTDITPGEGGQLLPEVGELTEADSIFSKFGDKIKAFMDDILEPFKNAWALLGDRWKQEWADLLKSFEHFCTSLATFLKSVWEHGKRFSAVSKPRKIGKTLIIIQTHILDIKEMMSCKKYGKILKDMKDSTKYLIWAK